MWFNSVLPLILFPFNAGKKISVADDSIADFLPDVAGEIPPNAFITM